MSEEKLTHACRNHCSGWQDGYDRAQARIKELEAALAKILDVSGTSTEHYHIAKRVLNKHALDKEPNE